MDGMDERSPKVITLSFLELALHLPEDVNFPRLRIEGGDLTLVVLAQHRQLNPTAPLLRL